MVGAAGGGERFRPVFMRVSCGCKKNAKKFIFPLARYNAMVYNMRRFEDIGSSQGETVKRKDKTMTIYYVGENEYFNLRAAKAEMKRTGLPGEKVKIYSNGEWVPCGEIKMHGSNRCHIVGARCSNSY